jgi:hypothetical protein
MTKYIALKFEAFEANKALFMAPLDYDNDVFAKQ